MRIAMKILLLFATALMLSSCASYWTRKECENTDWFAYGRDVAMQGRRLTGDAFIKRCEDAEADVSAVALDKGFKSGMENYCRPETVYQTGKKGEFFNVEMCDGEQPRALQKRHADGVKDYCAKSNAFSAGASGKKYNNICPKNLEETFLPEFNRGRKKYIITVIADKENNIDEIDRDIRRLESQRSNSMAQMALVGDGRRVTRVSTYDPVSRTQKEELVSTIDDETKNRRESIQRDIERFGREIENKQDEQSKIRKEIRELNIEMAAL